MRVKEIRERKNTKKEKRTLRGQNEGVNAKRKIDSLKREREREELQKAKRKCLRNGKYNTGEYIYTVIKIRNRERLKKMQYRRESGSKARISKMPVQNSPFKICALPEITTDLL